jgi:beta-phosphoglucomutase
MLKYKAAIFDLDGVVVDTAKYHFLAWKRLSEKLGIAFTEADNEKLKGVNRLHCLDIILDLGGITLHEQEKLGLAEIKNNWYREYIEKMDSSGLLDGADRLIKKMKPMGVRTAIGSASKNANVILTKTGIYSSFDAIVDGNMVEKAKPDPEVFIKCAELLGVPPQKCVVFEDSQAGITAAKSAGMVAAGIGEKEVLKEADFVFTGLNIVDSTFFTY